MVVQEIETMWYFIRSPYGDCGNCVSWWGKDRQGYTNDMSKAGLYTKKQALNILRDKRGDRAYPAELITPLFVEHVDSQSLRDIKELDCK